MLKENDLLEQALELAENGYAEAYRFLFKEYQSAPQNYGAQTLYFLACLAGGAGLPEKALEWLKKSIIGNGWWYRPEVLEDEDLAALGANAEFAALKAVSEKRYNAAVSTAKAVFSWERKTADKLFIAVHGNTQNGQTARADWTPELRQNPDWQIETVQSAEPDGYGTYRWSYDMQSFLPVADAIKSMQMQGYSSIICGGFSAGCDMLLRAAAFSSANCDTLILQSPWIPSLQSHSKELLDALLKKDIELLIRCGSADEDCLPMAKQLHTAATAAGIRAKLTVQAGCRHQFPN